MKLFFSLVFEDEYGRTIGAVRREVFRHEAEMGERIAELDPDKFDRTFDEAVQVLRVKQFRRDTFIAAAKQGGEMLADHLEDKEGWHGIERQERIREKNRRDPERV